MTNNLENQKLLSGNEAFALGAYHSGVKVAAAYPGTPSTEILETISQFKDLHAEWATNEKVAMEVALGACYTGVRAMASMKHVGLNVASDAFMAAATTGVKGGLVIVSADDPGIASSQNEQDNRHYAKLAKIPVLEPSDSQEAYDLMAYAFDLSEKYDTPVMVRTTTRISHSKSVVKISGKRPESFPKAAFYYNIAKFVMLPVNARTQRPKIEKRLVDLAEYAETTPLNQVIPGGTELGIVTSGISYQYACEVFPKASFLKLGMTYPLPKKLIRDFAGKVKKLIVIEELDPFLEDNIKAMGITVSGKEFIPRIGELSARVVNDAALSAGLLAGTPPTRAAEPPGLPRRPPLLCPGCPHASMFFTLSTIGQRAKLLESKDNEPKEPELVITGDIGCYTLATYPPLNAMDTTACMGASIGQAVGMAKAGVTKKVVAVIGDSTFLHSGITGLVNAVYNQAAITIIILDNGTTAMTGHQEHPGTGISAQGIQTTAVSLENLVRGIGVKNLRVVDAFDVKALRTAVKESLAGKDLSVIISRGACAVLSKQKVNPRVIDVEICNTCGACLRIGCPAIQKVDGKICIDTVLCAGNACTVCQQICPKQAIAPQAKGAK
ncbi:MAG: indolepyruvate ferredoxin oxidoreductase subunit alpha [Dehalococcoidales bacterium]|nr:indolepyruvate ferredoxin oxidoreductase subunit alpha [Dehalococcoidales bacterium]